MLLFFNFFF